ncbi:hypothetical protein EMIHUDRAFT_210421 [Emiliania huxleyi CCMP1516]|uniref:Uncharacterized protein n=2 Tax=Emiliania huxleyi TaxID=2903 RepID=A0A0D3J001_EMIH1|nr:hypothetical protein EMIHUDRAFT_210421 [Emiliania huxleyi CCMP1516]EOD16836.1 hypothetical protein EMIHUDRAFT_210421 [Emiliania huxleyi CCMP1516]|eukprot:XP_005769265.1 hypothetical protein EMIHUDRAFT_210421 [Emiliania huxleyi CCMP1516]
MDNSSRYKTLILTICAILSLSITSGHGLDALGSLGTVAVRGKAYEGWWNHMAAGSAGEGAGSNTELRWTLSSYLGFLSLKAR